MHITIHQAAIIVKNYEVSVHDVDNLKIIMKRQLSRQGYITLPPYRVYGHHDEAGWQLDQEKLMDVVTRLHVAIAAEREAGTAAYDTLS